MSNLENTTTALSLLELATAEAKKIFENYPELEEVYITSDMQGFKELEKAENQAAYLKNKKVHHFNRKDFSKKTFVSEADIQTADQTGDKGEDAKSENNDKATQDTDLDNTEDQASDKGEDTKSENSDKATQDTGLDNTEDTVTKTEEDERAELMVKYETKHGKKAPHNIGLEKLRASVED
ncbi:hypothetical protein [Riemerella anatipestifer]|uniref:hypothetical protein n=1 Tax=Riemerella anatipestifer TaxID=34085 RepID=UPI0021D5EFAA|nr:hypothetical protein [Riemerella anatipestifer]MCU7539537.1 hypothetical protein [Riemerella anatipestifer]